ncbi:GNAT family N-acetyltransferase [Paenibacillus montanisoli]|uniref:GNAT family N-acetyltransferase n=2 Tax=Paenibacillus montanisoli TaxID=2081970 RepID=A0A328UFA8_9BACL|nr:GNAT family N-acetyltransferase [Paenibacillus montanisoli]
MEAAVKKLDLTDHRQAEQLLEVQLPAYRIEAELIGFDGIPGLRDTADTLRVCDEVFYGCFEDGVLAGAISYKAEDGIVDIHRLVVHPSYHRRGIGERLVRFVLEQFRGRVTAFIVSTGAANLPAKRLYAKLGFEEVRDVEAAPGLFITEFRRRGDC